MELPNETTAFVFTYLCIANRNQMFGAFTRNLALSTIENGVKLINEVIPLDPTWLALLP
jgi:hypothetical protein